LIINKIVVGNVADAVDAAKQFLISGMRIQSGKIYQDITHYKTRNYLRKIALVGGGLMSSVTVLADFFGVLGSGLGLLLFICLIHQYYVLVFTDENSADQLLLIKNI
jgi:preprotein translocase subunit SecY